MKSDSALPGGSSQNKPTRPDTFACSAKSAFVLSGGQGCLRASNGRQRVDGMELRTLGSNQAVPMLTFSLVDLLDHLNDMTFK